MFKPPAKSGMYCPFCYRELITPKEHGNGEYLFCPPSIGCDYEWEVGDDGDQPLTEAQWMRKRIDISRNRIVELMGKIGQEQDALASWEARLHDLEQD